MGKKYVIDEETLTDLANGLRETLNDLDAKHKPENMRQRINDVYFCWQKSVGSGSIWQTA